MVDKEMNEAKTDVIREHTFVPVDFLRMLCEVHSLNAAADLIGLTPGTLKNDLREGKTRKVNELAAKAILSEETGLKTELSFNQILLIMHDYYDKHNIFSLPDDASNALGQTLRDLLIGVSK
jgi:hypothetical protein